MLRELVDPSLAHLFDIAESSLVDDPSDLRVSFGRRIHDEQMSAPDVAARGAVVGKLAGNVPPHDVEALHDAILRERGAFANRRCASIACDHEVATKIARAFERVGMNAYHAIFFVDQIAHRYAALELELGKFRCLRDDHLEHRRLRHDSRAYRQAVKWNSDYELFAAKKLGSSNRQIRQGVELCAKSGLVHRGD